MKTDTECSFSGWNELIQLNCCGWRRLSACESEQRAFIWKNSEAKIPSDMKQQLMAKESLMTHFFKAQTLFFDSETGTIQRLRESSISVTPLSFEFEEVGFKSFTVATRGSSNHADTIHSCSAEPFLSRGTTKKWHITSHKSFEVSVFCFQKKCGWD